MWQKKQDANSRSFSIIKKAVNFTLVQQQALLRVLVSRCQCSALLIQVQIYCLFCDMHHFLFFFFSAVFCSTTVRPSPTPSRQTGGLSPSVKMSPSSTVSIYYTPPYAPSSTVSIYYTRYTPLSTQVGSSVSTSTVSGKKI